MTTPGSRQEFAAYVEEMGYGARVVLKADQELVAVRSGVPLNSPVGESQSNDRVENAVQRTQGQRRLNTKIWSSDRHLTLPSAGSHFPNCALSVPDSWASHCVDLCNSFGRSPNVCGIGLFSPAFCVQARFQIHAAPLLNRSLRDRLCHVHGCGER